MPEKKIYARVIRVEKNPTLGYHLFLNRSVHITQ
jgi:hypothetical protein